MLHAGCHLSVSGGFEAMGKTALEIGADTFQFFTRNPRGGGAKKIEDDDAAALRRILHEHAFAPLVAHAPYTMNPCAADPRVRSFAFEAVRDDMARMAFLPGNCYNFHPGSHVGQGIEKGIELTAEFLSSALESAGSTLLLIETMSGKGSEICSAFEEIAELIKRVDGNDSAGVCLDTCHVYSAGYDIVNDLDGVLGKFDSVVGLNRLKAIHLNDSMTPFASRKDRHEKLGSGSIGYDAIARIINHDLLKNLPFILETPNELSGYASELEWLKNNSR